MNKITEFFKNLFKLKPTQGEIEAEKVVNEAVKELRKKSRRRKPKNKIKTI